MINNVGDKDNQCIVLMAHYLSDKVRNLFFKLKSECLDKYDVWFIYDNSNKDYDPQFLSGESRTFLFTIQTISDKFYMKSCNDSGTIYCGNTTFPVLEFINEHPQYDYYWRIEYDVWFQGNWTDLFDYFHNNSADLLTTTLFRYSFRPNWAWWHTLKTPLHVWKVDRIRGFLPVARLSKKACQLLYKKYRRQWKGHDEVVVPSLLYHYGMSIEDIGGDGEFAKSENKNRFYLNSPENDGLAPGTMVCPPCEPVMPMLSGKLYHAIK